MDELNKQNIGEETAAAHPVGENTQPVPPADTGAQQTQQPTGESATAPETQLGKLVCPRCGNVFEPKEKKCPHCGMKNNLKLFKKYVDIICKHNRSFTEEPCGYEYIIGQEKCFRASVQLP